MSNLVSRLKAAASEGALAARLGAWRLVLSSLVDALSATVTSLSATVTALAATVAALSTGSTDLTQAAWYVNATTGNDSNTGATSGTALKTLAELYRRTQGRVWTVSSTIYLSGDFTEESLVLDGTVLPGVQVVVRGDVTEVATGAISAFTAYNGATSTPSLIDDGGATDYSAYVGLLVRITSGAAINCSAPLMKAVAAGQFRPGQFFSVDYLQVNPAGADTFAIEDLTTKVGSFHIGLKGAGGDYNNYEPRCLIRDVRLSTSANNVQDNSFGDGDVSSGSTLLYRVCIDGGGLGLTYISGTSIHLLATYTTVAGYMYFTDSVVYMWGFTTLGGVQYDNCYVNVPFDFYLVQNFAAYFYGGETWAAGGIGAMEVGAGETAALSVESGAHVSTPSGTSYCWGAGNLCGYGIKAGSGSIYSYGVKPTVSGVTNDTIVGGTAKAYANIPFLNGYDGATVGTGNGAGIVVKV